jgi:CHAT domain-containing protein
MVINILFFLNYSGVSAEEQQQQPQHISSSELLKARYNNLLNRQYPVLRDKALTESLEKMIGTLVERSGKSIVTPSVVVYNDDVPNIFSFPNQICITTGLLDMLGNKDELAYLMSREIGYLANGTQVHFYESEKAKGERSQNFSVALTSLITIAGAAGSAFLVVGAAPTLTVVRSSPYMGPQLAEFQPSITSQALAAFGPSMINLGSTTLQEKLDTGGKEIVTDYNNAIGVEVSFDNQISGLKRQSALAKREGKTEASNQLSARLEALNSQHEKYIQRLRQENPRYAALWHPQPVMPEETPTAPGEYLLRYKVTDSALLVWLIKDGKLIQTETLPVSREVLRQKVQSYLGAFEHVTTDAQLAKYDIKLSNELYNLLFQTIAGKVPERSHVVIVPDDVLDVLPFESLIADMPAGSVMTQGKFGPFPCRAKFLADHYQVSYYYSATSMRLARQFRKSDSPSQSLFMVADPSASPGGQALAQSKSQKPLMAMAKKEGWTSLDEQFEPLKETRELSEKLKRLFPDGRFLVGTSATKDNLSGIEKHRYVVFATHGLLAREIPYIEEPALLLYPEGGADDGIRPKGFLTMSEVMKLNLTCDNASLTACSTGLGRRSSGEGVMSMGWAFQYAGAKSVMVSLWQVDQESSVLLAAKYFEQLKAGKDRMTALSEARTEIRRMGYEHPFYWAPFILIGEVN